MANEIKLKRSAVAGKSPTTSQLGLGEIALNTTDGKAYMKKNVDGTESIVEISSGTMTDAAVKTAYENNSDTNAFTDADHTKLDGIAAGAEVNAVTSVNGQTGAITVSGFSGDYDDLTNKPTLGTAAATASSDYATAAQGTLADSATQPGDLHPVATSGAYSQLGGLPSFATVATSGDYDDLTNKPTIPTNNNQLTNGAGYINGTTVGQEVASYLTINNDNGFSVLEFENSSNTSKGHVYSNNSQNLIGIGVFDGTGGNRKDLLLYQDGTFTWDGNNIFHAGNTTIPTNNNQLTNGAGFITGYTVTSGDVTGHEGDITITESQISDLGSYLVAGDITSKADLVGGKLSVSQLPEIAVTEYKGNVANQTAMLAVSGEKGDWVIRNDDSKVYVITGTDPSSASSWTALSYPAGGFSGAYSDLTGKPTIPTNNNQLNNGRGYITSFDITTQTDSKYLRSNADDTTSGKLWVGSAINSGSAAQLQVNGFLRTTSIFIHEGGTGQATETNGTELKNTSGTLQWNGNSIYHVGNKPSLADLGYTGATNANYITNNNQLSNGAGYITGFDITTQTDSKYVRSNTSDTMSGNLTIDNGNSTTLNVVCNSAGSAIVRAGGDSGQTQGTGAFEVSQDGGQHGGGISYNGDNSPGFVSGESSDQITFYRISSGTRTEVFHYPYNSSVVNFNSTPTVGGNSVYHPGNKPSLSTLGFTGASNANYITNNNQLSNGAGYITSANGGNAATVDGYDSSFFFKSYSSSTGGWEDSNANFLVRSGSTGSTGLCMERSNGTFGFQLYASGTNYGFLTSNWGSWDIKKAINGNMELRVSSNNYTVYHTGNLPTIPSNNNQLSNGAGYVTSSGNTVIGTDSDVNTSGATIIDNLYMTDGVITSHGTRTLTLADLGYSGATNANNITNNNQLSNGAGYVTSSYALSKGVNAWVTSSDGHSRFYFANQSSTYIRSEGSVYLRAGGNTTRFTVGTTGNCTAQGNLTAYSDINLKEQIEVIPNALEKVATLRGVTYVRKDIDDKPRQSGVIAQEVEAVLPEVVYTNDDGIKSVAYGNMVGLLIESIKELKAEIETLKAERN